MIQLKRERERKGEEGGKNYTKNFAFEISTVFNNWQNDVATPNLAQRRDDEHKKKKCGF